MIALRELQRGVAAALRADAGTGAAAFVLANGIAAERRLRIYANNSRHNVRATLEAAYPVLLRLAGEDWFAQAAREYTRRCPSRSGDLQHVGARFAAFLDTRLAGTAWHWFTDVARLEWAYQETLVAAGAPPFDPVRLANIAPADHARLVLRLQPTVRVLCSPWPILGIWKANQPGADAGAAPALDSGTARVLIVRRCDHVEMRALDAAEHALLAALAGRRNLAAVARALAAIDPHADLGTLLVQCAGRGLLAGFTLEPPAPPASGGPP
ncbi:MAG: putative DNA-binding domain-containing protein [Gammaproteobacteria bacterium]|nr:putative DNA-binding domain-containing protein [Gammaproteobacteria bacterium]